MRDDTAIGGGAGRFPTTRHSAVLAARGGDDAARERALDRLLDTYWKPAYKYVRVKWNAGNEDAKDLVQGFFARALEKGFFERWDPERGSFRGYLRLCLDGFISNERKSASRQKRSPGSALLSLDFEEAEGELATREVPDSFSPEEYFRQEWVRSLFASSLERLREECARRGRELPWRLFELYDIDPDPEGRPTYAELAARFEVPATTVTNHLFWARREFRRLVLERLREITGSEREFREEARAVLGVDVP
jgi:RNA polymerase sigma-70 factor (ECF subfamily)